jgi:EEF1A lysine methyltransferase 4
MDAENLDALRTKEYWNSRYDEEPQDYEFDWFKNFEELATALKGILRVDDHILMLGCGNSVTIGL